MRLDLIAAGKAARDALPDIRTSVGAKVGELKIGKKWDHELLLGEAVPGGTGLDASDKAAIAATDVTERTGQATLFIQDQRQDWHAHQLDVRLPNGEVKPYIPTNLHETELNQTGVFRHGTIVRGVDGSDAAIVKFERVATRRQRAGVRADALRPHGRIGNWMHTFGRAAGSVLGLTSTAVGLITGDPVLTEAGASVTTATAGSWLVKHRPMAAGARVAALDKADANSRQLETFIASTPQWYRDRKVRTDLRETANLYRKGAWGAARFGSAANGWFWTGSGVPWQTTREHATELRKASGRAHLADHWNDTIATDREFTDQLVASLRTGRENAGPTRELAVTKARGKLGLGPGPKADEPEDAGEAYGSEE